MAVICIKGADYCYFESLIRNLDDRKRTKLLYMVRKIASGENEVETEKIQIIPDDVHIITRMMINTAYNIVIEKTKIYR